MNPEPKTQDFIVFYERSDKHLLHWIKRRSSQKFINKNVKTGRSMNEPSLPIPDLFFLSESDGYKLNRTAFYGSPSWSQKIEIQKLEYSKNQIQFFD